MDLLRSTVLITLGLVSLGAMPLAAADDCKPVFDALNKVMTIPVHIYSTTNSAGKLTTSESIYTDDGVFTNAGGKWALSAMRREEVAKKEDESRKKGAHSCKFVKDEAVNGEMAAVYSTRTGNAEQKTEGQIWISKSAGVPLRNEIDLITGAQGAIRNHYAVRYEYKNVAPPKL